jgi:TonB family protein
MPFPIAMPRLTAAPTPTPTNRPSPTPMPVARPHAAPGNPNPTPSPMPTPGTHGRGNPSPAPAPTIGTGPIFTGAPGPAPVAIAAGNGGGSPSPVPVNAGGGGGHVGQGGGSPAAAPAPTRGGGSRGGSSGPAMMVAPSIPRAAGGGGGDGVRGNPDANNNPGKAPAVSAQADVDFGPYMNDLQRRIKRAWFPPKGQESRRVVVIFKVHRGGELSNLRLDHASGVASADQAALKAVENAAPFRPLPPGSADDVDIQFTFDYNVFSGGGSGLFRKF